eukprot:511514-Hanusia_phi.AAC.2
MLAQSSTSIPVRICNRIISPPPPPPLRVLSLVSCPFPPRVSSPWHEETADAAAYSRAAYPSQLVRLARARSAVTSSALLLPFTRSHQVLMLHESQT